MSVYPFISVLVPVRNEALFIEKTIKSLVNQDYPRDRFEVLVIDGGWTAGFGSGAVSVIKLRARC